MHVHRFPVGVPQVVEVARRDLMPKQRCTEQYRHNEGRLNFYAAHEPHGDEVSIAFKLKSGENPDCSARENPPILRRSPCPLLQERNADIPVESSEIQEQKKQSASKLPIFKNAL
jgi:hypothetical protein